MKQKLLVLASLLLFTPVVSAQVGNPAKKPAADPRVKAALDEIGYKFEMNADNDYKLLPIETEQAGTSADGKPIWRSQLVCVDSNNGKLRSVEIRGVVAPASLCYSPLPAGGAALIHHHAVH